MPSTAAMFCPSEVRVTIFKCFSACYLHLSFCITLLCTKKSCFNYVQAEKYIKALPVEKQPIIGTNGAKYRKKQLMKQLPPHDQEPQECHDLSPQETSEMQMFVKEYRQTALGVAKIAEATQLKVIFNVCFTALFANLC